MKGSNPIRPPLQDSGDLIAVKAIFPTLQGEGPYSGFPAVFVRLGGCNLACEFCDTEFEDFSLMKIDDIAEKVQSCAKRTKNSAINLVVITGGEPLRQNIAPLCARLISEGFKVQIETNGTIYRDLPAAVEIVCSPKISGGKYHHLRADLLPRISAFKFIISASRKGYDNVAEIGQGEGNIPVYVQPMDEADDSKNAANLALAKELALQQGYILSLQLHKIIGIE